MPAAMPQAHHIKALPPALKAMKDKGYTAEQCLRGTGLLESSLDNPGQQARFSLQQEFRFHRNLLELTGDPLLGLKLGKAYSVETYGLLGYAILSAPNLRQALVIVRDYGPLLFSLFTIDFTVNGSIAIMRFKKTRDIPQDLLNFYVDRDLSAAISGGQMAIQRNLPLHGIKLMHGGHGRWTDYTRYFGCPVSFEANCTELQFDASVLDAPMPMRDAETSLVCQQQCQLLLARMKSTSGFTDAVRQLIVARPGYFPSIEFVAEKLNMTSRTLRRRLADENTNYQRLIGDVKYQLALEYLATSTLPLEEIASLLGYSAAGNFTNAFKRWHGNSPRHYRKETR